MDSREPIIQNETSKLEALFRSLNDTKEIDYQNWSTLMNRKIAIIGGAGSIGSTIVTTLLEETNSKIFVLDSDESRIHTLIVNLPEILQSKVTGIIADIRDFQSINNALAEASPQVVIHTAALKHVTALEAQPREAYMTNVIGTANVLKSIESNNVNDALFISTDKAANPISILGKTKLIGEMMWGSSDNLNRTNFSVVRFGNVFMSRGSVVETFISQIKKNEPITITDFRATRFFITLQNAAKLIISTVGSGANQKLIILKMGTPVRILELARKLQELYLSSNAIVEIGLKSGEKLHEELTTDLERHETVELEDRYSLHLIHSLSYTEVLAKIPKDNESAKKLISQFISPKS